MTNRVTRCQAAVFDPPMDRLLLVKHRNTLGHQYWWLPGGGQEPGEEPEDCMRREIHEELGVAVEVRDSFVLHDAERRRTYSRFVTFICVYDGEAGDLRLEDKITHKLLEASWFDFRASSNWSGLFADDDLLPFLTEVKSRLDGPGHVRGTR